MWKRISSGYSSIALVAWLRSVRHLQPQQQQQQTAIVGAAAAAVMKNHAQWCLACVLLYEAPCFQTSQSDRMSLDGPWNPVKSKLRTFDNAIHQQNH
jgi:hypothetical protein